MLRPPLTLENAAAIREHVQTVDIVGSEIWDFGFAAQYKGESTNPNLAICGGTPEYAPNNTHYVGLGRNLSPIDVTTARKLPRPSSVTVTATGPPPPCSGRLHVSVTSPTTSTGGPGGIGLTSTVS